MKINRHTTINALACSALLAVATTGLSQNLLVNPGFEADAVGTLTTGWQISNAGTTSDTYARSGTKSLLIDSTGVGQWWSPNVFQSFPATPGQEFYMSGYMRTPATVAGASFGLFKIEFRDTANAIIPPASVSIGGNAAAPFYGAESTPFLNNASAVNQWIFSQTKAVAPANVATVWFYALNVNQVDNLMYFDDIVATNVVVPPSTCTISTPTNGATVAGSFTVNATASLPNGVISVNFYTNNVLAGTDTDTPYSFQVVGAPDGAMQLKAVANQSPGASVTSSIVNVTVVGTTTLYVDPSKPWQGFMNSFGIPFPGTGYIEGSGWATADLKAIFSGSTLTLSPNTISNATPVPDWYSLTGNGSIGARILEANMYVEPAGSLPGLTVKFTGMCITNSMINLNPAGDRWTNVAVIKDFAPDYSSHTIAMVPLVSGQRFTVTLATDPDPARHVQYGFMTIGPSVWPTDNLLPSYGNVVIAPGPAVTITPTVVGANVRHSFPSVTGYTYQLQRKNSLTDANWTNIGSPTNGTGSTIILTDTRTLPSRFYRLSVY